MQPTPLTVEGDWVYGHLGQWGVCHVGIGNKCVMLPKSRTDYQLFKSGHVVTDDGRKIKVGKITLGTGHAHPQYGIVPARDHYDNTGWAVAAVGVGEDKFGVWVNGIITQPEKADELRLSPLSGDWRTYNGNLELIAALAVNNPGFPVFNTQGGEDFSLVAAGVLVWEDDLMEGVDDIAAPDEEDFALREERLKFIAEEYAMAQQERRDARIADIAEKRGEVAGEVEGAESATLGARQMDAKFQVIAE